MSAMNDSDRRAFGDKISNRVAKEDEVKQKEKEKNCITHQEDDAIEARFDAPYLLGIKAGFDSQCEVSLADGYDDAEDFISLSKMFPKIIEDIKAGINAPCHVSLGENCFRIISRIAPGLEIIFQVKDAVIYPDGDYRPCSVAMIFKDDARTYCNFFFAKKDLGTNSENLISAIFKGLTTANASKVTKDKEIEEAKILLR